jgi:addiction module RelE/StbE family toxin
MAEVIWSRRALRDLNGIRAYIAQFNPAAAERLSVRLLYLGESLTDFPERGRPAIRGRRELATAPPYVVRYRVMGDRVLVDRVVHGRRRPL